MLFQRINRSDPEKVFIVAKNTYSTASLSNGQAVNWEHGCRYAVWGNPKAPMIEAIVVEFKQPGRRRRVDSGMVCAIW